VPDRDWVSSGTVGVLDGLVARVLSTYPYRFTLPATDIERATAYRIRAAVVAGRTNQTFPDGQERDAFDDAAVHVVGWDGGEPICTGRLVLPRPELPTERVCGITIEPRGAVVDVGRMAVVRSHRSVEGAVFVALLCRLYAEMRSHGFQVACGMMSHPARRLVALLGLQVEEIGPERDYWGELRAPVRFELTANADSIGRRWD
jgi:hypothetical protein